jgi:hypothetical protein
VSGRRASLGRACRTALAVVLLAGAAGPARAGWWDDAGKARETTLAELRAAPERWRDVPASLVVRFARRLDGPFDVPRDVPRDAPPAATPAASRAAPAAAATAAPAAPVAAWCAFAVDARGPADDGVLVVRRDSAEDARLATLRAGDQIRVRVAVRTAAAPGARPVVEVLWISAAGDALSPEELATLRRAEDFVAKDNGGAAEPLLRTLLEQRELSPPLRADLWRRIARAQRMQRKLDEAAASLRRSLAIDGSDLAAARELAQVEDVLRADALRAAVATETSARAVRPFPLGPEFPQISVPAPAPRLAAPRDRDGAPVAPVSQSVEAPAAKAPAAPTAPAAATPAPAPPVAPEPAPAPKLAAPK